MATSQDPGAHPVRRHTCGRDPTRPQDSLREESLREEDLALLAERIGLTPAELIGAIESEAPPRFAVDPNYEPKEDELLVRRAIERHKTRNAARPSGARAEVTGSPALVKAMKEPVQVERTPPPSSKSLRSDLRSAMLMEHLRSDRQSRLADKSKRRVTQPASPLRRGRFS